MCVLPGLVRLDLGIGGGLNGDGEEVAGGWVSGCKIYTQKPRPGLPVNKIPNHVAGNL